MKRILPLLLLLASCAETPVEKPIVDLDKLYPAKHVPIPPAPLEASNPFRRLYSAPPPALPKADWVDRLEAGRAADQRLLREERAGSVQDDPALAWTQSVFIETPLPVHDRYLYDPDVRRYTVSRYLDDLRFRYGGTDAVVLSAAYPNLGIDERNQYDFLRDLPGGEEGLRRVTEAFHDRGVKVLLTYHPWDLGTRAEDAGAAQASSEAAGAAAIARAVKSAGADGFVGDTMVAPPREYRAALESAGKGLAIEPEAGFGATLVELLNAPMGWADWREYQHAPGVDRYRWIEPRFRTHVGLRNAHAHLDELQYAWFNGAGFLAWENVSGAWNGLPERDAEIVRRMAMIYRALPEFPRSPGWEPHAPVLQPKNVFASRWPLPDSGAVWTFVNRSEEAANGPMLDVPDYRGQHFYELWTGAELRPDEKLINRANHHATLSVPIEPNGFAAVIETNEPPTTGSPLAVLLPAMRKRVHKVPFVGALSDDWSYARQRAVGIPATAVHDMAPAGMLRVPGAKSWTFSVTGVAAEDLDGADVQYSWESHPQLRHQAVRRIAPFYIDRTPVTNRQFKKFLDETGFRPSDPHNFLRDWPSARLTAAIAEKAVTWVSIEEARLYCRHVGKRLPHEWEWQLAAQGTDGRRYPWGSEWIAQNVPVTQTSRFRKPGPDVGSYPAGASPYGVLDMVGLVWQWTDEYYDEHTRAAVLKGGSFYQPAGSVFYFPTVPGEAEHPERRGRYQVDTHTKYLLMDPSVDRAGTIGFRCVVDGA